MSNARRAASRCGSLVGIGNDTGGSLSGGHLAGGSPVIHRAGSGLPFCAGQRHPDSFIWQLAIIWSFTKWATRGRRPCRRFARLAFTELRRTVPVPTESAGFQVKFAGFWRGALLISPRLSRLLHRPPELVGLRKTLRRQAAGVGAV